MAQAEKTEAVAEAEAEPAEAAEAEPAEAAPEVKQVTLDDFLAKQAEKKLGLDEHHQIRKANEGSSQTWASAKPLTRDNHDGDDFIAPTAKPKREPGSKQSTPKNVVVALDYTFHEASQSSRGAPRGAPRGGRGGRDGRGGRGRGRGGVPYTPRESAPRSQPAAIRIDDEQAFPSLAA